jgi:elongator complex protein 3
MDEDEIRSPNELREQDPSDTSHWNIAPEIIQKACREIIDSIIAKPNITKEQITPLKCKIQKKYNIPHMIKDSVLLRYASAEERDSLGPILRRRFTRTISGVIIVAVMTKPLPCPGKCIAVYHV